MSNFELLRLLLSLALLLSSALAMGQLFESFRLPRVIGEMCAGLLVGPSLLGRFTPELHQSIFLAFPEQQKILMVFYWLGLILLMFSAGFRVNMVIPKADRPLIATLIIGGVALPFTCGIFGAALLPNDLSPEPLAFSLVIGSAAAVTSIPVLTKIFLDLGIASGRFARLVLTSATIQDLLLWAFVSLAISIQYEQTIDGKGVLIKIGASATFVVIVMTAVPTIARTVGRLVVDKTPDGALLGYTLLVCLVLVSLAIALEVNVVFGALLAGIVIGRLGGRQMDNVRDAIARVSAWFFVPIYFSLVGFQISLHEDLDVGLLLAFLVASSAIKIISVTLAARRSAVPWSHALDYGLAMNARGGPGIVLASVAHAAGIIDQRLFVVLVITSIATSLLAGIWLGRRLQAETNRFL